MKKELSNYIHHYLGCDVQVRKKDRLKQWLTGRICEVTRKSNHGDWIRVWFEDVYKVIYEQWQESSSNAHTYFLAYDEIKILLRPLSSMTISEAAEYADFYQNSPIPDECTIEVKPKENWVHISITSPDGGSGMSLFPGGPHGDKAEAFRYLLSKQFDLFGLIEAGIAIDKTTL